MKQLGYEVESLDVRRLSQTRSRRPDLGVSEQSQVAQTESNAILKGYTDKINQPQTMGHQLSRYLTLMLALDSGLLVLDTPPCGGVRRSWSPETTRELAGVTRSMSRLRPHEE